MPDQPEREPYGGNDVTNANLELETLPNVPGKPTWPERMTALAHSFPCLRGDVDGLMPWDPVRVKALAKSGKPSHGERLAYAFLYSVWRWDSKETGFDLMEALSVWDPGNREAFLAWAREPFWP